MPFLKKRTLRSLAAAALVAVFVLLGICLVRALTLRSRQIISQQPLVSIDASRVAGRLAEAIRIRTISSEDQPTDRAEFLRFHEWLSTSYPRVHRAFQREIVGGLSLLYTWSGTDPSLRPVVLMAHMDVVPVVRDSEAAWQHPPFDGAIAAGEVWGRGAFDDKAGLVSLMEALESLIERGFSPRRTIHLALGHDEELGGESGARRIAELLEKRGVRPEFVLDEGGAVSRGLVPAIPGTVATVAVAEKGHVDVDLNASGAGGHSSAPSPATAIRTLSRAIDRVESNPMPPRLVPPVKASLEFIAPEAPFTQRLVLANLWATSGLVRSFMRRSPSGNAQVRTTCVTTILRAGSKSNVIPASAQAIVNCRILPGDTVAGVVSHIERVVADPNVRVKIRAGAGREPSPASSVDSPGVLLLQKTIAETFPSTAFAPILTTAGTDARHYTRLSDSVYRFIPFTATPETLRLIHGTNERVSVKECERAVQFYAQLLTNASR